MKYCVESSIARRCSFPGAHSTRASLAAASAGAAATIAERSSYSAALTHGGTHS